MTKVTADEVKKRSEQGEPTVIVDARAQSAWDESMSKAAGAIRISPDDDKPSVPEIGKDQYLVIYCT
jgi:rhodanese-related sulfurtransferase